MKKVACLALATSLLSANVVAETQTGPYINVFADFYNADWDNISAQPNTSVGESYGFGLDFGYRIDPNWAARIELAKQDFSIKNTNSSKSGTRMGADVLYHINKTPLYALAGLKKIDVYDDFNAANLGMGVAAGLTKNWSLNGEASWYHGINRSYSDFGIKLGVSYLFATPKAAAVPLEAAPTPVPTPEPVPVIAKPLDSDNDGIIDDRDNCAETPMTHAVDADGCTLYEQKVITVNLLVEFDHSSAKINDSEHKVIQEFAEFLSEHKNYSIEMAGHTSAVGSAKFNKTLSQQRAQAVKEVLVTKFGIADERIKAIGYGEEKLKNLANTEAAHSENRRVEATISHGQKTVVLR